MLRNVVLAPTIVAITLLSLVSVASGATQITRQIEFEPDAVEIIPLDGGEPDGIGLEQRVEIRYHGAHAMAPAGEVDLPTVLQWIEIPERTRLTRVEVIDLETVELGKHQLRAARPPARPGEEDAGAAATWTTDLFERDGLQPGTWAEIGRQGSMRGHQLAAVRVHPLRWDPATGRLLLARRLELRFLIEDDPTAVPLARHRIVPHIERRFDQAFRVLDVTAVDGAGGGQSSHLVGDGPAGDGPYQPTFRPSTDGSAVEYVLITNEELETEFQRLADWKTEKGVQAAIRTVEWIDETYPEGVDRAERIRFFIRDAYQNWGTLFVCIGGDTDVVPTRYAHITAPLIEQIPTDLYYACLDRNWNMDGDDRMGEGANAANPFPADSVDVYFEVSVGRISASTIWEARDYVNKLLLYERDAPTDVNYPASALAMAERLFAASHGADKAEQAFSYLPPWFKQTKLYEESNLYPGSIELTRDAALDSIETGYGIVLHVGHGYRNTMSVGAGTINNADIDALTNSPRNSVVFAINCSSASIDFNSIGERWIKNPNGGSVVYVGTSRLAYVTPSTIYMNSWWSIAFEDSVANFGLCTDMARAALAQNAGFDGATRWNLFATLTLGDPEVDMYQNEIVAMDGTHAADFTLGQETFPVTVTSAGDPVEEATVTLWRQGEAYAHGTTDALGAVDLTFRPETVGDAVLTAHKGYYRVYQQTVPVTPSGGPYVHLLDLTVIDDGSGASSGDGDGLADAGETVELQITMRNAGGLGATGVMGVLTIDDPQGSLSILGDTVSYGSIGSGGLSAGLGNYVIEIDGDAPVAYQPVLELAISANEGSWNDLDVLPLHRPYLEHYAHVVDDAIPRGNGNGVAEAGEEIWYYIDLRNTGQHDVSGVTATLATTHPLVTVTDNNSTWGPIAEGSITGGDRFVFELDVALDPSEVTLDVNFSYPPHADFIQHLDIVDPAVPDSIRAFGSPSAITLKWLPPSDPDVAGYDVFRSANPFGPYVRINDFTVEGTSIYEDSGLPNLTRFYYQVVARDASFNAGPASAIISGTTNPPAKAGWPLEVGQQSPASPTIVDIDGDRRMEVLTGAEMQYAWHCDGTEVVDGDSDRRTNGPFSLHGKHESRGFGASQAVGDMDLDGDLEIANVGFFAESLYVWNHLGQLEWSKWVMDDFNWASPVMADLDQDGDLEVIVWSGGGGRLFGWHHDGVEIIDGDGNPSTDGIMIRIFDVSFNYGSPAVGNLDADNDLEIVFPINLSGDDSGGVYAINWDGTAVAGWPVFTGEPSHDSEVSSSPVIADLDGNGDMEVIVIAERDGGSLFVYHHDGTVDTNFPVSVDAVSPDARLPSPVVADLDGDTFLDIIFPSTDGQLWAWDRTGTVLGGFPVEFADILSQATQCTPTVGDVDGDLLPEILFGDETGKLHGFNHDATELDGFPIQVGGEIRGSPAIWDCDEDNQVEVAITCYDSNVYIWDLPFDFNPTLVPWPFFRHDTRNTGYPPSAILPVGVEDPAQWGSPLTPLVAALHAAVPNPFNPSTSIGFDVPGQAGGAHLVELAIYDVTGRLVRQLVNGPIESGSHAVTWDGRTSRGGAAASGVYFAQLRVGNASETRKLVMAR